VTLPPYHWWRTVFFLIPAITIYTCVLGTISLAASLVERQGRTAHRCARWWSRAILWTTGVTIQRQGVPPPAGTSCIFVANHSSFYDIPILFTAVPGQLRIVAKAPLGRVPFIGWHLQRAGHLLVDRTNPGASVLKKMQRMAAQGASVIVFPEGSRTPDGRVMKFKGGVFLLAVDTGLPIVPISIAGSRRIMPRGRLMACPGAVMVTVHDPIPTAGLRREDARGLAERAQTIIGDGLVFHRTAASGDR
jgi:1-acyl-sn-glycerol-3-phosphate acyltransferase